MVVDPVMGDNGILYTHFDQHFVDEMKGLCREADILVVAIGRANFIKAEMVKPGAAVIDVGMNRLPDGKLAGDVDFAGVSEVAGYLTPVPGGVGPMTITMLLKNTVTAAEAAREKRERS